MSEATNYQMPYSLRRLFATLLVYCNPVNPIELWKQFEDSMSEDFKILSNMNAKDIRFMALNHINDILHLMGRDINEYNMIHEKSKPSAVVRETNDCQFERNIIVREEDLLLERKLNTEQRKAYDTILNRIFSNKSVAFFVDGPEGPGKTFLYRALLAAIRSKGFVALATTSSGVAASILPEGRTAHYRFKFFIDIDEQYSCNISKQSTLATLIRDAKLIVWDEVSMTKEKVIETFDILLKDLMDTNALFGGKVVVFDGHFRQTLSVVRSGKKEDFIQESLLYSEIWNQLEKLRLSENMCAKTDPTFCEYLMRIGNGQEKTYSYDKIEIPDCFVIPFIFENQSLDLLFRVTYIDLHRCFSDASSMTSRVILTTKNDFFNEINDLLISQFPGDPKTYVAFDETIETNDQSQYEDFLHTLYPASLPPHILTLKRNCPIMLL
uniref:ATP-dependent DNA helicase n=1 Tax=Nicotiana tabacum TaxID=4097 RepID=A0A1S3YCP9_TOBAC|nr:PREDICTED: uncharacterized protein LOC107774670 [Nicotiana tabacum]XP_016449769.1 PREDICTED: uncharacterized protein LOC107774670 [Nicotiana tabacum]XP_016449770.1 PREDICTED: uncharacterized protein LOC107774670 [Nicotiana tabacum]XP_016449771.1 PREDICTED: uncharacterized protein LOC107774670 [Nicotiana tabacum]XP_016449772.1 PREDICTED: uncharacterized protein LOC107774670 [Nicotiana tabacum]XP_016449773.1 PREDICTED: uncharacterized protein LOC107774670 [Nicotiana tabacum]XP_016449774.1 PR